MQNSNSNAGANAQQSKEAEVPTSGSHNAKPNVIGSFYSRDFGFENIEFEHTEDETVLIRCNSPEDLVTFEMSKQEAVELALAVLKNCL